jgi:malonyl CoA-acyl carrier protein transacylase
MHQYRIPGVTYFIIRLINTYVDLNLGEVRMVTYMFPGQGSQSKGMGEELFDEFPELIKIADEILGYSIKALCLKDPRKELSQTQFTQPAIFVVNALSYFKKIGKSGKKPDYVIGHSLGEFNALLSAESFDFETGLEIVKKRGELMGQAKGGGMAAILNATKEEIESILRENGFSNIDLANFNTPYQTVISGMKDDIAKVERCFQKDKIQFIPINASGAFHSRYMKPIKEMFANYIKQIEFAELKLPVIANVTARIYNNSEIVETIINQIDHPVKWYESISYLAGLDDMEFIEMGNGTTLTRMVQKIKEQSAGFSKATKNETEKNAQHSQPERKSTVQPVSMSQRTEVSINNPMCYASDKSNSRLVAEEKISEWNRKYPIGTDVTSTVMENKILKTRTSAILLFGFRAAVYMENHNGYFDLDEINAVETPSGNRASS